MVNVNVRNNILENIVNQNCVPMTVLTMEAAKQTGPVSATMGIEVSTAVHNHVPKQMAENAMDMDNVSKINAFAAICGQVSTALLSFVKIIAIIM